MITSEDIRVMRACALRGKSYKTDVEITVDNIASHGPNFDLSTTLSSLATGSDKMTDVSYRVVDFKGDAASTLVVQVSGRVDQVVDEISDAQTQDA